MAKHTAFFYGTLMAPQVLSRVCHGNHDNVQNPNIKTRPALLHNYRRHKVKGADYPAILPHDTSEASSVRGIIVSGLTDGDIWRLDMFEGDEYERRRVKARILAVEGDENGKGQVESDEEVEAETYIWIAGKHRLAKGEWDFRKFVKEKMVHWVGVEGEEEYKEVDDAVKAVNDPTGGRGRNGPITRAMTARRDQEMLSGAV